MPRGRHGSSRYASKGNQSARRRCKASRQSVPESSEEQIAMKWVPDKTGRFQQCPHYLPEELDTECEQLIASFLQKRYGKVEFPIKTEDLTVFIEEKADLDSFADLSGEEGDVEGMTEFLPRKRPTVGIAGSLNQPYLENRLRTTLTHEYGHVHYHRFMFDLESSPVELLFPHDR